MACVAVASARSRSRWSTWTTFKSVNDGHGHAVGDQVLARIASILRGVVREQDLVARLGGDEFLLLFTLHDHDHDTARQRCETVVDTIATTGWARCRRG